MNIEISHVRALAHQQLGMELDAADCAALAEMGVSPSSTLLHKTFNGSPAGRAATPRVARSLEELYEDTFNLDLSYAAFVQVLNDFVEKHLVPGNEVLKMLLIACRDINRANARRNERIASLELRIVELEATRAAEVSALQAELERV